MADILGQNRFLAIVLHHPLQATYLLHPPWVKRLAAHLIITQETPLTKSKRHCALTMSWPWQNYAGKGE